MPPTPPRVPRPTPPPVTGGPADDVLTAGAASGRGPLVEELGDGTAVVTFWWRDAEAAEVLLFVNRIVDPDRLDASLMERVPGTDLWRRSYRLATTWRAAYAFVPRRPGEPAPWLDAEGRVRVRAALPSARRDPGEADWVRQRDGAVQSVIALPDAPPQPWRHERPGVPRGSVGEEVAPGGRRVWVYEPPAGPVERTLVVFDGESWRDVLPTSLDNLLADGLVPPTRALLVEAGERRTEDVAGRVVDAWAADELLPWARQRWGDPGRVVVAGQSLGGVAALRTALRRPGLVDAVVASSASLWLTEDEPWDVPAVRGLTVRLQVGRHEWVLTAPHRALADRLAALGADVDLAEYDGGHDMSWWRGSLPDALATLTSP
ncbi:MAG: DUF3327 domain-containing protein [Aeromicrobium sp.]|uniref:enterochelin esterase domain-containing protein n=1 Tax=Aeromicrobium sp. TaxID=1871063 RepID=UPI0039E585BF